MKNKLKFRPAILMVLALCVFIAACNGGGHYKIVEISKDKGVMRRFYPDGKLRYEAEVTIIPDNKIGTDSNSRDKYVMNGIRREYYPNGEMSTLSFMKNGVEDHGQNTYTFFENGRLKTIIHDGVSVDIKQEHGRSYNSNNKTFNSTVAVVGPDLTASVANNCRIFKHVTGSLQISISGGGLDTFINNITYDQANNLHECTIVIPVKFRVKGDYRCLVRYALTDSISNIRVITDTVITPVKFSAGEL